MLSLQRQGLVLTIAGLLIATILLITSGPPSLENATTLATAYLSGNSARVKRLHMLVPATDPTLDFCRFLVSNTIAGFPDPILIGWNHHGEYDGKESHLFKISEGLAYLNSIPTEQDDDLVIMLDAYDIWLLLRPEVMISRYNRVIAEQAAVLEEQGIYGKLNGDVVVENTLLFGADKLCWPRTSEDPGCWSVPQSPMLKQEYGPDTDTWMVPSRPRWLNSGTLIGPLGHMRDMFNATMDAVHRLFEEGYEYHNSDQYYFTDVWGEQELTRMRLRDGLMHSPIVGYRDDGSEIRGNIPEIPDSRRTEYRLSVDSGVDLFQTAAGFTEYLTWMTFNNTTPISEGEANRRPRIDQLPLPEDVRKSKPPFETKFPTEGLPVEKGWSDVLLGVNTVQHTVWPLFHITGDKGYRDRWWHYFWAHPHTEALIKDAAKPYEGKGPEVLAVVDGVQYISADTSTMKNATGSGGRGGGWSDVGDRYEWDELCGEWEKDPGLYLK